MSGKSLAEAANGSDWIMYVVGAIFVLLTILLLSGKGAGLIAGYNTASKEESRKKL